MCEEKAVAARLAWNDFITIWPTLLDVNLLTSLSAEFQSNSKICCYLLKTYVSIS